METQYRIFWGETMQSRCEFLLNSVRQRETVLETMQLLLKQKLVTKRIDLTVLAIYYKVCNVMLRAMVKIVWRRQ